MHVRAIGKSKRFNEIFHIMLEHRLPSLVTDMAAYARGRIEPGTNGAASVPHRTRQLLEDLGPTFIKIGQLMGTRPDLIPQDFVDEFKKMYDQTPPTPFELVRARVEAELGKPLDAVFREFDPQPLASASIAQVHRAVLRTGEVVAVKVQHPGSEERMHTDFDILRGIVQFTEKVFAATRIWQPSQHLEEIRHMLNEELDFTHELRTMQQFEENFSAISEVKIPHAYAEHCTQRVLVMEFIDGTKFRNRHELRLSDQDGRNLARIVTHAMAKQIFVDRLFHADPSPGNLLLMGKNQICFLDFGAVGQVTKRRARLIFDFIAALNQGNLEETSHVIVELCEVHKEYDAKKFLQDLERIIEYYETMRAGPADPVLLQKIIDLANRHGLLLPSDFMLITRSLYQFDGMCKELDPDYELVRVLTPFIHRTLKERFLSPQQQAENLAYAAHDLGRFLGRLPGRLDQLMIKAEKGQLTTRLEIQGLEDYKRHNASGTYTLGFTLLVIGVILAGTLGYGLAGPTGLRVALLLSLAAFLFWSLVVVINRQSLNRQR